MMPGIAGLTPDKAMKNILLGDFGKSLCDWLNRHQKGNRLLMETLTGKPYVVKAVTPNDLLRVATGEKGPEGLRFVLDLCEAQQKDVVGAVFGAIQRAPKPAPVPAPAAEPAPAEAAAEPAPEPTAEAVAEPVHEPTAEPAPVA